MSTGHGPGCGDGAFIAAAPQLVAARRAALVEATAIQLLYRELYEWRAQHDPEPIIQTWASVTAYDRTLFRERAAQQIAAVGELRAALGRHGAWATRQPTRH